MWSRVPQWTSWNFQPQFYQNMSHEEVDWAALAKQWIQMKETQDATPPVLPPLPPTQPNPEQVVATSASSVPFPPASQMAKSLVLPQTHSDSFSMQASHMISPLPPPPPPPPPPLQHTKEHISGEPPGVSASDSVEDSAAGGEMDMEIEDDKESSVNDDRQIQNGEAWTNWNASAPLPSWGDDSQQGGSWNWGWQDDPQASGEDGRSMGMMPPKDGGRYSWGVCPPGIMQRVMDYGHRDAKREKKNKEYFSSDIVPSCDEKEADFQLDAAQRKRLPAWIREGLEKMEKEKQRKLEKERRMNDKEELLRRKKEAESHARKMLEEDLRGDGQPHIPRKSKFESDSEGSGKSRSPSPQQDMQAAHGHLIRRRSRFDQQSAEDGTNEEEEEGNTEDLGASAASMPSKESKQRYPSNSTSMAQYKTEEERMAEMMTKLRKWMTEILLDVTSTMMREVASDVINKTRMKAPAVQVKKSSALVSLSGGLGLSIYSDSESDEEGGTHLTSRQSQGGAIDSDEELRQTIQRKRSSFEAIERGILQRLQAEEEARRDQGKFELQESSPKTSREETSSSPDSRSDNDEGDSIARSHGRPSQESEEGTTTQDVPSDENRERERQTASNSPSDPSRFSANDDSNSGDKNITSKDSQDSNSSQEAKETNAESDSKESSPKNVSGSDSDNNSKKHSDTSASSEEKRKRRKRRSKKHDKKNRYSISRSRSRERKVKKKKKRRRKSRSSSHESYKQKHRSRDSRKERNRTSRERRRSESSDSRRHDRDNRRKKFRDRRHRSSSLESRNRGQTNRDSRDRKRRTGRHRRDSDRSSASGSRVPARYRSGSRSSRSPSRNRKRPYPSRSRSLSQVSKRRRTRSRSRSYSRRRRMAKSSRRSRYSRSTSRRRYRHSRSRS